MGVDFHETVGGKQFLYGTVPELVRAIKELSGEVSQLNGTLKSQKICGNCSHFADWVPDANCPFSRKPNADEFCSSFEKTQ